MALRIETGIGAVLIFAASAAWAQPFTYEIRHEHLHGGAMGELRVDTGGITFTETGKNANHSRTWKYTDIQQLSLSAKELRILTYEDRKWELGRDRDYDFDHLPERFAPELYPLFARTLDQRFIAELADPSPHPLWQIPVKLRHGRAGSEGALLVCENRIVYQTNAAGESRTWRFQDIDSIATGGLFDFSITTLERSGWRRADLTEFRFQLKERLAEDRYNDLWRRLHVAQPHDGQLAGR